jgi:aspartate carbamoyltransferase regulatory subunit
MRIVAEITPEPLRYILRCLEPKCYRNQGQNVPHRFRDLESARNTAVVHANDYQHRVVVEVEE